MARDLAQAQEALARANEIRLARAETRRRWKGDGTGIDALKQAADLIMEPPWWAETWAIGDVLRSLPAIGAVRAGRILMIAHVQPYRTLGGMTHRQRVEVVAEIDSIAAMRRARRSATA